MVIRAYALNKAWLIGFLMDIFGALLMLRALSLAPVIRAYALNKAWLIGFLMDIFGALLVFRALSLASVCASTRKFRFFYYFFLVSVFRVIFIAICSSIWWLELMVCHILEMGLSLRTAEEIFRDYSARRTDVIHALTNVNLLLFGAKIGSSNCNFGTGSSKIRPRSSYSNGFSEMDSTMEINRRVYVHKKASKPSKKAAKSYKKNHEKNSAGLKIAVTESLSCSSSSPPPTKHPDYADCPSPSVVVGP